MGRSCHPGEAAGPLAVSFPPRAALSRRTRRWLGGPISNGRPAGTSAAPPFRTGASPKPNCVPNFNRAGTSARNSTHHGGPDAPLPTDKNVVCHAVAKYRGYFPIPPMAARQEGCRSFPRGDRPARLLQVGGARSPCRHGAARLAGGRGGTEIGTRAGRPGCLVPWEIVAGLPEVHSRTNPPSPTGAVLSRESRARSSRRTRSAGSAFSPTRAGARGDAPASRLMPLPSFSRVGPGIIGRRGTPCN